MSDKIKAKFDVPLWARIKCACGVWWAIVVTGEIETLDDGDPELN